MCGIAGFCNEKIDRESIIHKMNNRMIHRGPDAEGIWLDDKSGWAFGHRRLAIRDLSTNGAQPMLSASGRFVIAYNGEVYNASEIKEKMASEGKKGAFKGTSDTEIILEAIEAYGIDATLSFCKGMFAIAVYDRKKQVLYLTRDRVGEKPLYYGFVKDSDGKDYFAFASDLALFSLIPGFEKSIDRDALAEFMLYSYIKAPRSIYSNIKKLEPGTILELRKPFSVPIIRTYWAMKDVAKLGETDRFNGTFEEAAEHLQILLEDAIKGQMISDVPLGAYLSGGIDSSLIVALAQKITTEPIKTFTIGFDDPNFNEAEYARNTARLLGTKHTELMLSEKEMKDAIPKMAYYFSEPFGDSSMIPTYFLSKLTKQFVTVSLSGDAGDELFCGYEGYWKTYNLWNKMSNIPKSIKMLMGKTCGILDNKNIKSLYRAGRCLLSDNICQSKDVVFNRKNFYAENIVIGGSVFPLSCISMELKDEIGAMELLDMTSYHPDDILVKVDRAGMASSLENRIPMLDKDVIEFAWRLPAEYKYKDGVSKRILREILYKYVPEETMERPKHGFTVPLRKWLLEGETNLWAGELVDNSRLVRDGLLDGLVVKKVWNDMLLGKMQETLVWNILMAESWYRSIW